MPAEPNASPAYEEAHSAEGGTDTAAGESAPVPAPTLAEGDVPGNAGVDWSVPDWVRHPRLEGILGVRFADITWNHIVGLASQRVAEDLSIDFKQGHYVLDRAIARNVMPDATAEAIGERISKDRFELAKDVTAFANAAGGLIVIGVSESNGRAHRVTPVDLKDKQRLAYLDIIRSWTAPYISAIEVGHLTEVARGQCCGHFREHC